MSHFTHINTQIKDPDALRSACTEREVRQQLKGFD